MKVVVCGLGGDGGWDLPGSELTDRTWIHGGERTLYEIAVAAASAGFDVELRGEISRPELDRLARAAGAAPRVDVPPRLPAADDVVVVPEGWTDPLAYGPIALSPARRIMMIMAPLGLFGWPFVEDWTPPDPSEVPIERLARDDHFRAIAALGFECWTHSPGIAAAAERADVSCRLVGSGQPELPEPPTEKTHDVVFLGSNRWAAQARIVADRLGRDVIEIPKVPHTRLVQLLGASRVLIWPSRVEGHARVPAEARSVATVPVALDSNPFAVGLTEEAGAVPVRTLDEMPAAIQGLLDDPERLGVLSRRGVEWERRRVDWDAYVDRIREGLRSEAPAQPAADALALFGSGIEDLLREEGLRADRARRELEAEREARERTAGELVALRGRRSVRMATGIANLARPLFAFRERRRRRGSGPG